MGCIVILGMWNHTPHIPKGGGVGCPLVPRKSFSFRWLIWMACSRAPYFICELFDGAGRHAGIVHEHTTYATYHRTLVVHVCATFHLTNLVLGIVLGGLAKRAWSEGESDCGSLGTLCPILNMYGTVMYLILLKYSRPTLHLLFVLGQIRLPFSPKI